MFRSKYFIVTQSVNALDHLFAKQIPTGSDTFAVKTLEPISKLWWNHTSEIHRANWFYYRANAKKLDAF